MPLLLELTSDSNAEVRNNAIYGIGEIAYHGKDVIFSYPFFSYFLFIYSIFYFNSDYF